MGVTLFYTPIFSHFILYSVYEDHGVYLLQRPVPPFLLLVSCFLPPVSSQHTLGIHGDDTVLYLGDVLLILPYELRLEFPFPVSGYLQFYLSEGGADFLL